MGTDDDELFSEEEEVGEGVIQGAQASIQVAAAHVGGGNDGASEGGGGGRYGRSIATFCVNSGLNTHARIYIRAPRSAFEYLI